MRAEAKSTIMWALVGIAVGFLALWQSMGLRSRYIATAGFAVMFLFIWLSPKIFGKKDIKWLIGNGVWPYLTTWYASWVLVYAGLHI